MPKLKSDQITLTDLEEYLNLYSDFAFELRVLQMLRHLGLSCEHGGLYEDPVTKKSRQFDIRAQATIGNFRVRMSVECKNIQPNFPVLVSCVPRHPPEAYHQVALVTEPEGHYVVRAYASRATVLSLRGPYTLYRVGEPVGKATAQIGRALDGTISVNDSELYEKWGQCLSSADDLLQRAYLDGNQDDSEKHYCSTVLPCVVVPDGSLWTTCFADDGTRLSGPTQADRCPCFAGKEYLMGSNLAGTQFLLSHVEIMTVSGLQAFVERSLMTREGMASLFPAEGIVKAVSSRTG
jgi:hypothetical protein